MKRGVGILAVVMACVLVLGACASNPKPAGEPVAPPAVVPPASPAPPQGSVAPLPSGVVSEGLVTATATIEKVDVAKRRVTIKGQDGRHVTLNVDPAVKNLPQVKKGDQVVAAYYEAVAFQVKRPGEAAAAAAVAAPVNVTEELAVAKPGQKPGAVAAQAVTITTTIEAIDAITPSVTLRDPSGDLTVVKVRDPKKLQQVRVGDLVDITYTEAVLISVQKPEKK